MEESNDKIDRFVHYQKINIFGEQDVGKSSLIDLMENYDSYIFKIDSKSSSESFIFSSSLIEQTKEIVINLKENKNLYFNVYETNLDRFDFIKMNLDTLLLQTDCIIIMWDNSFPQTFENIPVLISTIEDFFEQTKIKVPIFVLQNKMDLPFNIDEISITKDKFTESISKLKENSNIIYNEITLKDNKNKFYELLGDIEDKLSENLSKKKNPIYEVKYHHPLIDNTIIKEKHLSNKNITRKVERIINCMLLGHSGTGKTSYLNILNGKSILDLLSTIGLVISTFNCMVKGEEIIFRINDTAGQERFSFIPKNYYRNSHAFLLFFDVTNEKSFNSISDWIENIVNCSGNINEQNALFLVANKIDETEKRRVKKNEAKELAKKYNAKYFEISCLKKINIYELLYEITLMAYQKEENFLKENNSFRINKSKVKKKQKKWNC